MTIPAAESLPTLDIRALSDAQLPTAETIFKDFRNKELQPAYLADADPDPNRALLDRRVVCDLLGFDETIYTAVRRLSDKWCAEPSVQGSKRRPPETRLVTLDSPCKITAQHAEADAGDESSHKCTMRLDYGFHRDRFSKTRDDKHDIRAIHRCVR